MSAIAFKEWSIICDALGSGQQSIIIRKGGISEGTEGFKFRYPEFFLFPTLFHEQVIRTRLDPADVVVPSYGSVNVTIRYFARVEWTRFVDDWPTLEALEQFHVWKSDVVRERFEYDEANGVHIAFLRIFRLEECWKFPDGPEYGGCKSWVEIPEPPACDLLQAVLTDTEHEQRSDAIQGILQTAAAK